MAERWPLLSQPAFVPDGKRGIRCCFDDVRLTCGETTFCLASLGMLCWIIVDLSTTRHLITWLEDFLTWLEDCSIPVLMLCFIGFGFVWIVFLVPTALVTAGGGFVCAYKFNSLILAGVLAFFMSSLAFATASIVSFGLARYMLQGCAQRMLHHFGSLTAFDLALKHNGRKMNLLLRINPVLPYNVLNWTLGLSTTSMVDYIFGLLGAIPYIAIFVYAGLLIDSLTDIDDVYGKTSVGWIITYCVILLACIVSVVLLYRYTKAEMAALLLVHGHGGQAAPMQLPGVVAGLDASGSAGNGSMPRRDSEGVNLTGGRGNGHSNARVADEAPATRYKTFRVDDNRDYGS